MYDKFTMSGSSWTPGFEGTKKSSGNRLLVFLVVVLALATIALAAVLAVVVIRTDKDDKEEVALPSTVTYPKSTVPPTSSENVCLSEGCVLAAARVRNAMDTAVWPCEDFYQFACGSWLKQHVIPEDKSSYGTFTQMRDDVSVKMKYLLEEENKASEPDVIHKVKDYYKACANEDQIEKLGLGFILDYLESFGGMPALGSGRGGKWNETAYNLEDLMLLVRRETNTLPIVDIWVAQDDKNPTKHILTIDQTQLGMPSRDYYLKGRNDSTLMAYQKMLTDILVALGADQTLAENDAKALIDFEVELANITMRREDRRDPEKLYNKMTVGDLRNNFTDKLDWIKLAKGTLGLANITIDETESVIARAVPYFQKFMDVVSKQPKRVVANYLVGNRVLGKTFYLPAVFTSIKLEYTKALTGSSTKSPRWQSCADNVVSAMSQVAGRLFSDEYFKKEAKEDVLQLIEHLRSSMKEIITDIDWMQESTKTFAREKADYIEPRIGYPDWVYNNLTKLEEKFQQVEVNKNDPLQTLISFNKNGVQQNLIKLRREYDRTQWGMSPAEVNAYYNPAGNQITFPAAILQEPFYSKDQPAYLNYGGIGYVIGHEITHGFDDQGRQYDKEGNLKSWWTMADAEKFKQKAQCMIEQYGSYVVPGTGNMTLNGITTQGENIADNGGLKESFKAYRKWIQTTNNGKEERKLPGLSYTPNQLFFMNAAQVWCTKYSVQEKIRRILTSAHPLDMFRVYGPLQNSHEFAEAFQCPVGSRMNPEKKCAVW